MSETVTTAAPMGYLAALNGDSPEARSQRWLWARYFGASRRYVEFDVQATNQQGLANSGVAGAQQRADHAREQRARQEGIMRDLEAKLGLS